MLWHKTWLETRWRFLIGMALLLCSAAGIVFTYPKVLELMPLAPSTEGGGELARRIREAIQLSRDYRGYVWSQAFRQNLVEMGTLFAVLLGTGGMFSGRAALFTLSLPMSRTRLLGVRAALGLVECLALALIPPLLITLLSPAIGAHYALPNALGHGLCLFFGGATFFSLALLLSTWLLDVWRPLLFTLAIAAFLGLLEQLFDRSRFGVFKVMSGETLFREGHLPWLGLLALAALSGALLAMAARHVERRDF